MNNDDRRKVDALELLAVSHAMQTCMQIEKRNAEPHLFQYDNPSCSFLSTKYAELAKKQTWK